MDLAPRIMILRHAEKPNADERGVNYLGRKEPHGLTVRGWQRAGALVSLFDPPTGTVQNPHLAKPAYLAASSTASSSGLEPNSKSHRERETLTPLAQKLNLHVDLSFDKGDEMMMISAALRRPGPVLIAWEHSGIATLGSFIPGENGIPPHWPDARYDILYVFSLKPDKSTYTFTQVPQLLLAGDLPTLLSL